ncbi:hypothetical protein Vretimale_18977 [Volvox reticuliferus]|uniref:RAMA domain-containing protein n=2 Tax=Volvox reticuliferus TaxID=1737510 RepID=A0A8J4D5V8_9CHLO|nr:hypothetical protein Vretifemale_20074 [Volvox reticuliferus]GIM16348.1 hypothetical protein Vretimale_18977 [Volvox reticuliferus]
MADITSRQRQQSGAGGHGQPISAQLTHGRTGNDADDSGTDTDDEGRLIQQAAATAKARSSEPPSNEPAHPKPFTSGQTSAAAAAPLAAATTAAAPPPPVLARTAPQPAPAPRGNSATAAKGKAPPKRPAGAITLRTLLDAGFVVPGSKVLYVEYKGLITWADLTEEGSIVCDGQSFESPSAFSIYVKRKLNPERKADDGWKAVKYAGKLLEHFKELYLRQQLAASGLGNGGVRGATPTGSLGGGGGGGVGPSPHSSTQPSPQRQGGGEATNGAEEDGPPSKRQRLDRDADGPPGITAGGAGRPGLKIKIKLKPAAPAPARPGPLLPLPAPPVATVACGSYAGTSAAGSGKAGAQPFRLLVSDMVVIVMDFHAHCSSAEVGGLLAGTYDATAHTVSVKRAFPVLELQQASTSQATSGGPGAEVGRPPVAVEFDPTDFARVMEVIRNWGLTCVGSYRSHPAYSALPNVLDVLYAARAQEAARTADGTEPSVCAVVAPYGPALGGASSAITWFHVEYDRSQPVPMLPVSSGGGGPTAPASPLAGFQPMALEVETAENPTSHMDIMSLVSTQFHHTARTYAVRPTRAPMGLPWRPPSIAAAASVARPQQTCLDKLVASVVSRLPDMFEGDLRITYGTMVRDMVQHEFAQAGRMGQGRAAAGCSEDGAWGPGISGGSNLATGRSRRTVRSNGAVAAAVRFHSDEEETEEEDDVQLDDEEEAEDHEI